MSRIKGNPGVLLTVIRGQTGSRQYQSSEHIYEDILYSDTPQLSKNLVQLDLVGDFPPPKEAGDFYGKEMDLFKQLRRKSHDGTSPSRLVPPPQQQKHHSERLSKGERSPKHLSERVSADSGLSSGTSGSPTGIKYPQPLLSAANLALDRRIQGRHSYRTEREIIRRFQQDAKRAECRDPASGFRHPHPRKKRIDGEYEVEVSTNSTYLMLIYVYVCMYVCVYVCTYQNGALRSFDRALVA